MPSLVDSGPYEGPYGRRWEGKPGGATTQRLVHVRSSPRPPRTLDDVGKASGVAKLFDGAEARFGAIDVLVCNAAIMKLSRLAETDDAMFNAHIATNIGGVFWGMREAAERLCDGGRIISVSSSVVGLYQPNYGLYAATKAAVEALTHVLAKELGGRRITVNAVAPGPTDTDLFFDGKSDAQVNTIRNLIPLGRLGDVEDIASVVAFLASQESGFVSGQIIRVNGGMI